MQQFSQRSPTHFGVGYSTETVSQRTGHLPVSPHPAKNKNKISILLRKAIFGSIAAMQCMHRLKLRSTFTRTDPSPQSLRLHGYLNPQTTVVGVDGSTPYARHLRRPGPESSVRAAALITSDKLVIE